MSNHEVIREYSNSIKNLKKQCIDAGMTEDEFRRMYLNSLETLDDADRPANVQRRAVTKYRVLLVGLLITLYIVYDYKSIYSSVVCNLQEYIYPGLKLLRKISIPFISLFPSLTGKCNSLISITVLPST